MYVRLSVKLGWKIDRDGNRIKDVNNFFVNKILIMNFKIREAVKIKNENIL